MKDRRFCLTSDERALLAPVNERQWAALYDAARLYEDVLGLLVPPMHERGEVSAATEFLGSRVRDGWTTEAATAVLHWRTSLPLPVCKAFLMAELDECEQAGLV